ncbi:MAG TPA: hypothetical protein VG247_04910 [Pseudonocardiaceae bacterium]|jgi:hypothetical protein|nr:hypothetical protein [Pseudonocardiaceae bacterium]
MNRDWPVADLDPVRRLRVLATTVPGGAVLAEGLLDAPFDLVWAVAADLEHEFPKLVRNVRSMRVVDADGERLVAEAVGYFGLRDRFDIVLRPGWCVMESGRAVGGMAAVAEGEQTRFAFFGGLRVPGSRLLARLGAPLGPGVVRRLRERVALR